jgi:hypothetical protein
MAQYISQMRRGIKDDATGRDDWKEYEANPYHMIPLAGELVLEYDNGVPRLKIGDGVHKFSQLPYMSVDSFILPKTASVYLNNAQWKQAADDRYYQVVTVQNATITPNSKVDLTPSPDQLTVFHQKDLAFITENEDGVISVYCVGQVPTGNYTIPVAVTEVLCDG